MRQAASRVGWPATVSGVGLALAVTAAAPAALAQGGYAPRGHGYREAPRYVVAESQWGNGTISGPIRPGRYGWQVRLPRGTWIDCVRSCSDTLRRQTIDFWESNGPQAPGSGRGYLNWEFRF